MRDETIGIQNITSSNFAPFGTVFEFPKDYKEQFLIVDEEENEPWRVAVFRFMNRTVSKLEKHPNTKETFEPLQGTILLLTAQENTPDNYQCFLLDKPVSLKKGIWHQVMAVSHEAQVKITENLEVSTEFYKLEKEIRLYLGSSRGDGRRGKRYE